MAFHPQGRMGFCDSPFITLSPFWSLAVEEHFYLIWPLIVSKFGPGSLKRIC
jgi:peptidoglycan/LPS O-acetylase OafA/YrhL